MEKCRLNKLFLHRSRATTPFFLLFISVLLVISFICIVGKNTGVFGKKIKEFYFNMFGVGSFIIVPAVLSHLLP